MCSANVYMLARPVATVPQHPLDRIGKRIQPYVAYLVVGRTHWSSVGLDHCLVEKPLPDRVKSGYRTWRQVINESRRFDLRYREDGGLKAAW